jgi:hypothetical protein
MSLADEIEEGATVAHFAAAQQEAQLESFEQRWRKLVSVLERVVRRAGVRLSAEEAAATDRLERLEERMGKFEETLEEVTTYLGVGFDRLDRLQRPRPLDEEEARSEWMYPVVELVEDTAQH